MGLSLATRQKPHEVADTAGRVDSREWIHFWIKFDKQVVGKQWLTDCSTFSTHDFFQGDHRCQAIHSLSFEVFLGTLKLPALAVRYESQDCIMTLIRLIGAQG